jgi:L-arabinose isomerase
MEIVEVDELALRREAPSGKIGARRFVNEWNANGPAHHCAVGVGHIAGKIEKLGKLLRMETARVC